MPFLDELAETYSPAQVLNKIWGYPALRGPQQEVVPALLAGQDVLAILPTGGGKSLCFQLPALLQSGTTLVVTPLIALMEDQVQDLRRRQIAAAGYHSELPDLVRQEVLQGLEEGRWQVLYISPEGLLSKDIWSRLGNLALARLVIDEAHCLATWGASFRPAYRRLGAVRRTLNIPVAAFTATASPETQRTITEVLHLQNPHLVHLNPYRANLILTVQRVFTPRGRRERLLNFLKVHRAEAGLVYVRSRTTAEQLTQLLAAQGFVTAYYHAGLLGPARRVLERQWLDRKKLFLICTSAFGMGINHTDLRWVAHFESPVSTEEYLQEIGRAGRDGQLAHALLIASEPTGRLDPTDQTLHQYFAQNLQEQQRRARARAKTLPQTTAPTLLDKPTPELAQALSLLHQSGCLHWETPFQYRLTLPARFPDPPLLPSTLQSMQQYPHTRHCRWQFLLASLGHTAQLTCGHCDNCQR
ncbi:ATP-dependent DNA helicase RecQ [Candidatus Cyanaurora vandensis]|uniref:RecQ family ATP-dependent DNA helicase n=1 Tax=Candidatus Cyanaurora vandensis TaxID=2714958 RepID=UPI002579D22D|nr:RecQ family ATP-dependent DNA helicase [Candidatus Cyanaurora vandensis]